MQPGGQKKSVIIEKRNIPHNLTNALYHTKV